MRRWAVLLGGLLGVVPSVLIGQRPGAQVGRFEVPGLDWNQSSAWRTRAALVRTNRWEALRRGDLRSLNGSVFGRTAGLRAGPGSAFVVSGLFKVPVVLIGYKNVDVAYPVADFQSLLFDAVPPAGRAYTLKTYYEQVSRGRIQMDGLVFPTVRVDSVASYYENNCNGIGILVACPDGGKRFGLMLLAVLDSLSTGADAATRWSQYDNDGPDGLPNSGDDDGFVDFVTFLQPTKDGACGATGIWAHRFVISAWNGNSAYLTKTPKLDGSGQPTGQFLKVDNYTIQSQLGGTSGCNEAFIMPIGTVAHETGHAFGLPDLYDTSGGSEGIGEWGIMGSGNYAQAYSPASYDAWSLNELGWITVDTIGGTREITTAPRVVSDTIFLAKMVDPAEFLLIENRQSLLSDTAMFNPTIGSAIPPGTICRQRCPKVPGLLVWHIDLDRIATGRQSNRINTGPIQGVALEQADGLNNLRSSGAARNRGDAGDTYPGSVGKTRWSLATTPSARTNKGDYAGFILDRIAQLPNGAMRFRHVARQPSVVRATVAGATITVDGVTTTRYEDVIAAGDQFQVGAEEAQETDPGRSRARWLAWSIGGPRIQTVTSGATPDTITATFAAEHRLRVTSAGNGQGSVVATAPDAVGTGVFVPQGTPITVTATPQTGSIFVGWRGDTTTTNTSLTLPMNRAYDIEAAFTAQVEVVVAAATADILGGAQLTTAQRLFLDELGNRNGVYDVGDFLAYLKRNGQAVSPALLKAIVERQTAAAAVPSRKGNRP